HRSIVFRSAWVAAHVLLIGGLGSYGTHKQYRREHPVMVKPREGPAESAIIPLYKVMPFDPPYAPGTEVAGIRFDPHTLDVRLYLSVHRTHIKNLDMSIKLINTSPEELVILALKQRTAFPGMTIAPDITPDENI